MQSETGFPSSHQLKSYVAYKSRLKLVARAVLSADAGLLVSLIRVIIGWNQLDQRAVGASSINAFKGCLNKIRETRMGFFMD